MGPNSRRLFQTLYWDEGGNILTVWMKFFANFYLTLS